MSLVDKLFNIYLCEWNRSFEIGSIFFVTLFIEEIDVPKYMKSVIQNMKILIVEDEQLAAQQLKSMLQQLPYSMDIVTITDSISSTVTWLKSHQPDLIFMDIHLGDGSSFRIFDQIKIDVPIIFTTAYDEYALEAFKNKGVDYLLKPFDIDDLQRAMDKLSMIKSSLNTQTMHAYDTLVPNETMNIEPYQRRFLITVGNKLHTISTDDIAYFMADGKYLFVFTFNGSKYPLDQTIGSIEAKLDPKLFFKINRKFIINIGAIAEMSKFSNSRIKIILHPTPPDDIDAIVSGDRILAFKQWLNG